MFIDPDVRSVELYRRGPAQSWVLTDLSGAAEIELCGVVLPTAALFDRLDAESEAAPNPDPDPDANPGAQRVV